MSEQIIDLFSLDCECSICLENIIGVSNKVVTDCGHTFHCKCIMTNISFNGFSCPFCRNVMADLQEDSDSDSNSDSGSDSHPNTIISPEDEDEDEDDDDDDYSDDVSDDNNNHRNALRRRVVNDEIMPESGLIIKILQEQGYTMEDLVKLHLYLEHSRWGTYYQDYENVSRGLFSLVLEIIEEYKEPPCVADIEDIMPADPTD